MTNKRKILVDLIVLTLGQKKKKEKLWEKLEMERSRPRTRRRKQKKFMWTYGNIRTLKMQMIWVDGLFQNLYEICMTPLPPYLNSLWQINSLTTFVTRLIHTLLKRETIHLKLIQMKWSHFLLFCFWVVTYHMLDALCMEDVFR